MSTDERDGGLRIREIYRFFRVQDEETLALRGVSLSVGSGELVAVTGPSGAGKSTLLACAAGTDEPDGGWVYAAGQRLSHQPERVRTRLRGRHIGLLGQRGNLLAHLTVAGNIALAQSFGDGARQRPARALLDQVGLGERAGHYPDQLSGGELARAGVAVALANSPAVLLADEPTGELDTHSEERIIQLLAAATQQGAAVLVASHSSRVAAAADRVVRLKDGAVQS